MRVMRQFLTPLAICGLMLMAACTSSAPTTRGEAKGAPMAPQELAQSDVNRMATLAMQGNIESLLRIADKLYRRNPAEWRKTGLPTREAALTRLRGAIDSGAPAGRNSVKSAILRRFRWRSARILRATAWPPSPMPAPTC